MKNILFLSVIIVIGLISNIFPQAPFRSGIFLHHSTGGIIWDSSNPDVPQLMNMYNTENNYTGNNAVTMNIDSEHFPPLPEGNFYDTWHAVFVGQYDPTVVAQMQQYIQNNSIVVIKACWGGSGIAPMGNPADTLIIDDEAVNSGGRTYYRTQWHWRSIIRVMQSYPDNFFVIWTGIPLTPGPSYDGTIAHNFFLWAKDTLAAGNDPMFGNFPDNVYVFDAFHLLATPTQNYWWGTAYWGMNPLYHDEGDNHPNEAGANVVAQPFVWETFNAAIAYEEIVLVEETSFSESITTYTLEQNYPNPFNPNTKIKYSVPQSSNITIKVFDILGNDIVTLVNTEKPVGIYEVEFDATTLTSGVYFYRLQAGSFVETKKMILAK
jgi:hypothetical protein